MNAQEMHIEVNISSQKIRSNYNRKFLDSEVDWILNKSVDRFIKDRIKQDNDSLGFDATEIDLDALRTIVMLDRTMATFQQPGETDATRAELPGDYAFLIDDFSNTIDQCDKVNYTAATNFVGGTINIYAFQLVPSALSPPTTYYKNMSLMLNGTNVFNAAGLPGTPTADETFAIRDYILNQLWLNRPDGVDFYWERFAGTYVPNSFLAVSVAAQGGTNTITIDGVATAAVHSTMSSNFVPIVNAGNLRNNRLVRGHFRSQLRTSAFAKTSSASPISAISGNQLKIYHDGKFIVSKLLMSYVRKPAKINLFLNQNCDLADNFHQEICDRAVLYIKELTASPDWEIKLRDMMTNKD
jgi:hypothetical protein